MIVGKFKLLILNAVILSVFSALSVSSFSAPTGVYAIWAKDHVYDYDYVDGGQIFFQWGDLHFGDGKYDFSPIAQKINFFKQKGMKATLQVNGNKKPEFLFNSVPYTSVKITHQVLNSKGTLMYWHPNFKAQHYKFLEALSNFLNSHPNKDVIIGIRTTYNPVGTEHWMGSDEMPPKYKWTIPNGVAWYDLGSGEDSNHKNRIDGWWIDLFDDRFDLFFRNNNPQKYPYKVRQLFDSGKGAPYQTGSEMEAFYNGNGPEWRFGSLLKWCRGGYTRCYSESFIASDGTNGFLVIDRWTSYEQWMWWHVLFEMHLATSYVALYGEDLDRGQSNPEYRAAFEFARKYAGYGHLPRKSPGAWIAFREGKTGYYDSHNPEWDLRKDYTFHANYVESGNFKPINIADDGKWQLGDQSQRYGVWAKRLSSGTSVQLDFNDEFIDSISGQKKKITVRYLDRGNGTLQIKGLGSTFKLNIGNTSKWKEASFEAPVGAVSDKVNLTAIGSDITLHMFEIERGEGSSVTPVASPPLPPSTIQVEIQ